MKHQARKSGTVPESVLVPAGAAVAAGRGGRPSPAPRRRGGTAPPPAPPPPPLLQDPPPARTCTPSACPCQCPLVSCMSASTAYVPPSTPSTSPTPCASTRAHIAPASPCADTYALSSAPPSSRVTWTRTPPPPRRSTRT